MTKSMRISAVAGMSILALAMAGCGAVDTGTGSGTSTASGAESGTAALPESCSAEKPFVAVLLPNQSNPYYVAMQKGFEEAAEQYGFEVQVQIAQDDDAQQLAQAQAALEKKPCALALNPVKSEPAAAIVHAANADGVPVFTVNINVDDEAMQAQGAHVIQYLGADNKQGGIDTANKVLEDLGSDAQLVVGIVTEPDEAAAVERANGFKETITSDPNATVAASVDGNVKAADALNAAGDMLQGNPDMNVIYTSDGPATQGALEAVAASGRDVKVYGFCATGVTLTDAYPACVAQEPEDYGRRVMEQIHDYVGGSQVEANILRPLKMIVAPNTPAEGEIG